MGILCKELDGSEFSSANEAEDPEYCDGVGEVEDHPCWTGARETLAMVHDYLGLLDYVI